MAAKKKGTTRKATRDLPVSRRTATDTVKGGKEQVRLAQRALEAYKVAVAKNQTAAD